MRSASRLNSRTPRAPRSPFRVRVFEPHFDSSHRGLPHLARLQCLVIEQHQQNAIGRRAAFDDAEPLTFLGTVAEGASLDLNALLAFR